MFTGTTIDELINSVERAERHAQEQEKLGSAAEPWMINMQRQELSEVA